MTAKQIFFVKGRSYGSMNLLPAFEELGRVTIGWLPWIGSELANCNGDRLDQCFADISSLQDYETITDINGDRLTTQARTQLNKTKNFVARVKDDCFIIIPRPDIGAFYIGRIDGEFHKFPFHLDEIAKYLPETHSLDSRESWDRYGQLLQGWNLKRLDSNALQPVFLRRIALHRVPGVLRKIMACRQAHGAVVVETAALEYLNSYLDAISKGNNPPKPTSHLDKLRFTLTTTSFEAMCIELLNCRDEFVWMHVGGAGDGGIDGAAFDREGNLKAVLQCKFESNAPLKNIVEKLRKSLDKNVKVIAATLWNKANWSASDAPDNLEILLPKDIADMTEKYSSRIPSLDKAFCEMD